MSATVGDPRPDQSVGDRPGPGPESSTAVMRNSIAGSVWTVVSRLTGLGKVVAIGAVLGATYLGNTYQAVNSLPNLIYYQLLAGALFSSLLVPPLVRHLDLGHQGQARRLVSGFLGSLLLLAAVVSVALVALGPVVMHLLTLGVADQATAAAQRRVGWLLLVMFVPQIGLYLIAGTGAAVMNAHGRFALAAAAPALESLGMIVVLVGVGVAFGTGLGIIDVPQRALLLLGLGTTAAVSLHAACQWWGARASGLTMIPRATWHDPEVRQTLRRIVPTLGFTGLAAFQIFATMVVANKVAGGNVAFQLALNFFFLPMAVVTWPMARALLPQLARLHHAGDGRGFHDELLRAVTVALFITVPVTVAYLGLSGLLSHVLAFGELARGSGPQLMALSLVSLAPGIVGETLFTLGTYAFYARQDVRSPLRSMAVRVTVFLLMIALAWRTQGPAVLIMLGLAYSLGTVIGALHIGWRLRSQMPRTEFSLLRPLARTVAASLLMIVPAYLTALAFSGLPATKLTQLAAMTATALVGIVVFLGIQALWGAPELGWLKRALVRERHPPADPGRSSTTGPPADGQHQRPTAAITPRSSAWVRWRSRVAAAGLLPVACLVGVAIPVVPAKALLLGLAALLLITAVALRPALATYLLIGLTPLTAGIDRGMAIPILRPNEALLVLVGAGLIIRGIVRASGSAPLRPRFDNLDLSLLLLAFTSSVLPLLWMLARRQDIVQDDLLYTVMMWKYYGIYLVARHSIRTPRQVRRCLWISMISASVVAVIAILQSLQLFGVTNFLETYYASYGNAEAITNSRGGATLSLPIAVADLMTFNLAIATGYLIHRHGHRVLLLGMAVLFMLGALSSGEFSGAIGLFLGIITLGILTHRLRLVAMVLPVFAIAGVALRPVIEKRLEGFGSASGLPESWIGRMRNLTTYFWPELFSDGNFILGVRPAARVVNESRAAGFVWIESGYTWLLWSGGIPLLLACLYFLWIAWRQNIALVDSRTDDVGIAALSLCVAFVVIAVLMTIDPHLTYRGSADLVFLLLGITAGAGGPRQLESPTAASATAADPLATRPRQTIRQIT
jgi:murein biosynthesis integral membrane protein MurJ